MLIGLTALDEQAGARRRRNADVAARAVAGNGRDRRAAARRRGSLQTPSGRATSATGAPAVAAAAPCGAEAHAWRPVRSSPAARPPGTSPTTAARARLRAAARAPRSGERGAAPVNPHSRRLYSAARGRAPTTTSGAGHSRSCSARTGRPASRAIARWPPLPPRGRDKRDSSSSTERQRVRASRGSLVAVPARVGGRDGRAIIFADRALWRANSYPRRWLKSSCDEYCAPRARGRRCKSTDRRRLPHRDLGRRAHVGLHTWHRRFFVLRQAATQVFVLPSMFDRVRADAPKHTPPSSPAIASPDARVSPQV